MDGHKRDSGRLKKEQENTYNLQAKKACFSCSSLLHLSSNDEARTTVASMMCSNVGHIKQGRGPLRSLQISKSLNAQKRRAAEVKDLIRDSYVGPKLPSVP